MSVDAEARHAVQLYRLMNGRVEKAVNGVSFTDLLRAPKGTNSLLWSWGHLTNARCGLAIMLGVERERFHTDLFSKGAEVEDPSSLPSPEETRACWDEVTEQLEERFESMSAEEWSQPAPRDFPIEDKTLRGAATFLSFHEGYHLGQMALVRKWLGLGRLVG